MLNFLAALVHRWSHQPWWPRLLTVMGIVHVGVGLYLSALAVVYLVIAAMAALQGDVGRLALYGVWSGTYAFVSRSTRTQLRLWWVQRRERRAAELEAGRPDN